MNQVMEEQLTINEQMKKTAANGEKILTIQEEQAKIFEVRKQLGQLEGNSAIYCSDSCVSRYLRARNWNVKKATKMLKDTLKWRAAYKPEDIRWEDVAHEAETGKIYRSNYLDKFGRSVLVMRPSFQNTNSTKGQIKYLVYCMENAIMNLAPNQEKMVWLIDFHGYNLSHVSLKQTKETAHVLQNHYPERLGLAILYNAPKFFEPFWMAAKVFLEPKTHNKVKFVYSDVPTSIKIMENLFDMSQLEASFGGKNEIGFNISSYSEKMKEDDKKIPSFWAKENSSSSTPLPSLDTLKVDNDSQPSDEEKSDGVNSHVLDSGRSTPETNGTLSGT